jgi:2-oxoglutarate-Fe(II)-dependent oxygenase superfamily protein
MNSVLMFLLVSLLSVHGMSTGMFNGIEEIEKKEPKIQELEIVNNYLPEKSIAMIKTFMDDIEKNKLDYPDYAGRKGVLWSDVWGKKDKESLKITESKNTIKVSNSEGSVEKREPQSIFNYSGMPKVFAKEILPTMLNVVQKWTPVPSNFFAQLFVQRCNTSDPMAWHQDPGEDYDVMANHSLVLYLSEQDKKEEGWHGGEFKIRSGFPTDKYDDSEVMTIIPRYNQGVIFNNQLNSHAVTKVIPNSPNTKRDIIVAMWSKEPPKPKIDFLNLSK